MWCLDADVISTSPINWLAFVFEARHIGNRTLIYVAYQGGRRITLGSIGLAILPNQGKSNDCRQSIAEIRNLSDEHVVL